MIIQKDARTITPADFPQRYKVIIADCPWNYVGWTRRGSAKKEYKGTLLQSELEKMPIDDICFDDCVLLLWGTWPKLPTVLSVLQSWRFDYVTGFPWVKTTRNNAIRWGTGYWVRGCSEYVFIGKKGKATFPKINYLGLLSPNLKHSRKPDSLHEYAESMPGPYLELFARRERAGWDCFGNEVKKLQTGIWNEE